MAYNTYQEYYNDPYPQRMFKGLRDILNPLNTNSMSTGVSLPKQNTSAKSEKGYKVIPYGSDVPPYIKTQQEALYPSNNKTNNTQTSQTGDMSITPEQLIGNTKLGDSQIYPNIGLGSGFMPELSNTNSVQPSPEIDYNSKLLGMIGSGMMSANEMANRQFAQRQATTNAMLQATIDQQNAANRNAAAMTNNQILAAKTRYEGTVGESAPQYEKATYTPVSLNFTQVPQGNTQSNPYLGMFDSNSGTQFITPNSGNTRPQGMSITENGKSIFDSSGKVIPNKELTQQMKNWINNNEVAYNAPKYLPETPWQSLGF